MSGTLWQIGLRLTLLQTSRQLHVDRVAGLAWLAVGWIVLSHANCLWPQHSNKLVCFYTCCPATKFIRFQFTYFVRQWL